MFKASLAFRKAHRARLTAKRRKNKQSGIFEEQAINEQCNDRSYNYRLALNAAYQKCYRQDYSPEEEKRYRKSNASSHQIKWDLDRHRLLDLIQVPADIDDEGLALSISRTARYTRQTLRPTDNTANTDVTDEDNDISDNDEEWDHNAFFSDTVKSPSKAQLLYYMNAGLFRFQQYKEYGTQWDNAPINLESLKNEINEEMLTPAERIHLMETFLQSHSYTEGLLPSCGCCGIRLLERQREPVIKFRQLMLDEPDAQILVYTSKEEQGLKKIINNPASEVCIPIDEAWNMKTVQVWKARSVYIEHQSGRDKFWHLHPELVNTTPEGELFTTICPSCNDQIKKEKRPLMSIANGVDFGYYQRLGLTLPDLHEQLIISRSRLFFATIKVSHNTYGVVNSDLTNRFKCHAVIFPHDSSQVASYMFNPNIFGHDGLLNMDSLKGL